jgi:2-(1,2-epoxy-1,2-dihydrophenyl)acetyl-CoA isomerase
MKHIRIDHDRGVGTLTIDRRQRFNSLDVETAQDLRAGALALARDESVRCMVIQGQPGAFCSGVDLKYVRAGGGDAELGYLTPEGRPLGGGHGRVFKQILEYLHSTISEIRRAAKPVVAVVDGMAAAGGLGLAICCDLVYASERASFEWAYGRTGLSGAESTTFLLPRLVGLRRALELVFLNPRLDARRARDLGLVTDVFFEEELAGQVGAITRKLAAGPTAAWAAGKALLNRAAGMDRLDFHLDQELASLVRSADSPEFAAGLDAFFERRGAGEGGRGPASPPRPEADAVAVAAGAPPAEGR